MSRSQSTAAGRTPIARWAVCWCGALASWLAPAIAHAGPFPPIAVASVTPEEPTVGDAVTFSSEGSFDPDDAPAPLTFAWDFDDGTTSTEPSPTHTFGAPGAYRVRVVVSDGSSETEAGVTAFVLAPATAEPAAWSAPLVLLADRAELWVVNDDAGSVSIVDTTALTLVEEIPVCDGPASIAVSDADRVVVGCAGSGEVVVIDPATREVVVRRRLSTRIGSVVALADGRVLVTLPSEDAVVLLDTELAELARFDVPGEPRALARDASSERAYVASFLSRGEAGVTRIDLPSATATRIGLAMDPGPDSPSSSRGIPNVLGAIAIDPSGETAWIGGLKANIERGLSRDGLPLTHDSRVRGMMTPLTLGASDLETLERRIDTNDADAVSAIAFSPRGRFAYVTHPGIGSVSTYDLAALRLFSPGRGAVFPFRSRVVVGDRPDGIVVSPDGLRGYVRAALSRTVVVLDLTDAAAPETLETIEVVAETLEPEIALGRRLFSRSVAPVHSRSGYVACASCHPGGGHDAQTWDFTHAGEGLRNTIDLRGHGGTLTGPLHWSANFDEVQDFENDIVTGFGGTGLAADGLPPNSPLGAPNAGRSAELDALAAYVESLVEAPRSPHRSPTDEPTEAGRSGALVFERAGCAECHAGPLFTDSSLELPFLLHDVGTLTTTSGSRLGSPLTGLDTPSLLGVWGSAPYFHDGSAATLEDVLARETEDRHGHAATLGGDERADLAAFLRELDRPGAIAGPVGCGCRASRGSRSEWVSLAVLLLFSLSGCSWLSKDGTARDGSGRFRKRGGAP